VGRGGGERKWRCQANMVPSRPSQPDFGLGFQVKVLKTFKVVLSSLRSGFGGRVPVSLVTYFERSRERERDRSVDMYTYVYLYMYIYIHYRIHIYIYIYIYIYI